MDNYFCARSQMTRDAARRPISYLNARVYSAAAARELVQFVLHCIIVGIPICVCVCIENGRANEKRIYCFLDEFACARSWLICFSVISARNRIEKQCLMRVRCVRVICYL